MRSRRPEMTARRGLTPWGLALTASLVGACSDVTVGAATSDQPDATATSDQPDVTTTTIDRPAPIDTPAIDVVLPVDRALPSDGVVEECLMCGGEAGARCVDPLTDENHCGGCNQRCTEWDDCVGGVCQTRCPSTQVTCGTRLCVDLQSDSDNCGMCGRRCCPGSICSAGACAFGCSTGTTRCCASSDPAACNCSCHSLLTDQANCGACGLACPLGQVCQAGRCAVASGCAGGGSSCSAGLCACSGRCTDLQTDVANCGRCGELCQVGESCTRGVCTPVVRDAGSPDA